MLNRPSGDRPDSNRLGPGHSRAPRPFGLGHHPWARRDSNPQSGPYRGPALAGYKPAALPLSYAPVVQRTGAPGRIQTPTARFEAAHALRYTTEAYPKASPPASCLGQGGWLWDPSLPPSPYPTPSAPGTWALCPRYGRPATKHPERKAAMVHSDRGRAARAFDMSLRFDRVISSPENTKPPCSSGAWGFGPGLDSGLPEAPHAAGFAVRSRPRF